MAIPLTERNLAICVGCDRCLTNQKCLPIYRYKGKVIFKLAGPTEREYFLEWYQKNREKQIENGKEYWRRNKLRYIANLKFRKAMAKGKIVPPSVCSHCGKEDKVQGHHPKYSAALRVIWLCKSCHLKLHRNGLPKL